MLSIRLMSNIKCFASLFSKINGVTLPNCRNSSTNEKKAEQEGAVYLFEDEEDEESIKLREAAVEKMRNKSELFPPDYNRQHGRVPYEKPEAEFHEHLEYRRRLYGKYGESSQVNPSILWPSKKELLAMKEYEEVVQPFTLKQLVAKVNEKKALAEERRIRQEKSTLEKVANVKLEILKFHKRVAAEKEKALKLMERKNKLIEQVRQHFGFKMDPKDERFKEMLEKLHKEERKKNKALKKSAHDSKRELNLGVETEKQEQDAKPEE